METVIFLIFTSYFVFSMLIGQRVAMCLFASGLIGMTLWSGPQIIQSFIEADVFYRVATYAFITIPLYILMAEILLRGGVVRDLFGPIYKLSGNNRTLLAILTICLGGLLGGACGSVTAISAGFATIVSPELNRYGYKKDFTITIAAAGGSLAAIVPPSIVLIIYGSITETSIGKLFMGSVIPGILTTMAYIIILAIFEKYKKASIIETPKLYADESTDTIGRNFYISSSIILLIIVIIFGGIYSGMITATEAGGVASFIALIAMLAQRKLSLEDLKQAGTSTAKVSAMILMIVIGAQFFSRFLSLSMIPRKLIYMLEPFTAYPYFVCFLLFMIIFLLGMILESSAVILMVVPIMIPIINALHVDNIWFGVVASFTIVLGVLTPPVGMAIYAACAASKTAMEGPFRFSFWFSVGAGVIVLPIMFLFPETVTYLPRIIFD